MKHEVSAAPEVPTYWLVGLHPGSVIFSPSASSTSPTGFTLSDRHVALGMGPRRRIDEWVWAGQLKGLQPLGKQWVDQTRGHFNELDRD